MRKDGTFRDIHRPNWFEAVGRECRALRSAVGMIEISGFARYEVEGPGAEAFLDRVLACRLPQRIGRTVLAPMLNSAGGIIGDFTVTRLSDTFFWLVSAGAAERFHMRHFADQMPAEGVDVRSVTLSRAGLCHCRSEREGTPGAARRRGCRQRPIFRSSARGTWNFRVCRVESCASRSRGTSGTNSTWVSNTSARSTMRSNRRDRISASSCAALGRSIPCAWRRAMDDGAPRFTADTTPFEAGLRAVRRDGQGTFHRS